MALAYYNEIDPYAAQWLRNLIAAGHIAHGDVDERSVEDVKPAELVGYTQCHFFAGIGVWSHALRQAGWPDDKPVWTGSCPCQPFSAAGKGGGFDDERHLWPAFHHLIEQCKPATVIGEQVASKDANAWLDLVQVDLEALGYAFGAVPFPSASVGAPHIRDRLYWVADAEQHNCGPQAGPANHAPSQINRSADWAGRRSSASGRLDHHHHHQGLEGHGGAEGPQREAGCAWATPRSIGAASADGELVNASNKRHKRRSGVGWEAQRGVEHANADGGMADTQSEGSPHRGRGSILSVSAQGSGVPTVGMADTIVQQRPDGQPGAGDVDDASGRIESAAAVAGLCNDLRPGPTNGFWRDADWLLCRDGKWRPVEPGTFPLAHGATSRVGRLRAYGNAINAEAAREFISAYMA